jgi:hypothetical protein
MANYPNLGGMLTQAGQRQGKMLGGAFAGLGQDLMKPVDNLIARKKNEGLQKEVQDFLAANKDNPAALNAEAARYTTMGNDAVAKVFSDAAKAAVDRQAKTTQAQVGQAETAAVGDESPQRLRQQAAKIRQLAQGDPAMTARAEKLEQRADELQTKQGGLTDVVPGARRRDPQKAMDSYAESQAKGQQVTQGRQTLADSVNNPAIKKAIMAGNEDVIKKVREEQVKQEFAEPKKPESRNVKSQKMDDGSVVMFDGNTGDVIQTIKPDTPEKQQGQVQLIDKLVFQENRAQQLIDEASGWDTGLTGGVLSMVPGSDAYDRDAKIVNLKSNLGFDQIEEMKKQAAEFGASGTGLGQISNIEFLSLQSTVDTLRVGMSEEAQKEALENIKEHLSNIRSVASGAAPKDAVKWNSPDYKERGYAQDPETGRVFYAPDGPQGSRYELINGEFVKMRAS